MIKEIDTGKIVYSCKDPDVCVSAAQASRESDAWFVHVYRQDRQMASIYYVGEYDKLMGLCEYLFKWAGGVPDVSDEYKHETLAELSADLRRLGDKWIDDKAMVKMECLGLIAGQIADRIDAAAKRGRDVFAEIIEIAKAWAEPGADAAVTLGLIIDKAWSGLK